MVLEEGRDFGNLHEGANLHAQVSFLHNLVDLLSIIGGHVKFSC